MSIPIKRQNVFDEPTKDGFVNVAILCDGSMYGVMQDGTLHALGRSYVGEVLRKDYKSQNQTYHALRQEANKAIGRGHYAQAFGMRNDADTVVKGRVKDATKMLQTFKAFRPKRVQKEDTRTPKQRHKERQKRTRDISKETGFATINRLAEAPKQKRTPRKRTK
jgi:hypothetical protein